MSLFTKGKAVRRIDFREALKRTPYRNPGSIGSKLNESERMGIEKELEGEVKLGGADHIEQDRCQMAIDRLNKTRFRRDITLHQKAKIERKLQYLREVTGLRPR